MCGSTAASAPGHKAAALYFASILHSKLALEIDTAPFEQDSSPASPEDSAPPEDAASASAEPESAGDARAPDFHTSQLEFQVDEANDISNFHEESDD